MRTAPVIPGRAEGAAPQSITSALRRMDSGSGPSGRPGMAERIMMPEPLLDVRAIDAFYGDFQALFGVSLRVNAGEVVAVIGANGAGKSTLLKCIAGMMPPRRGDIQFDGDAIAGKPAFAVVGRGIALVPEGRRLFPSLTVEENLKIGGQSRRPGPWTLDRVYQLFPVLAERRHLPAPALSGGQQQMAAIARALMANPRLLLCDEISLGLAPIVVREIYARLPAIAAEGLSLIVVEQDIAQALKAAAQVYCLQEGRIALQGAARALTRASISAAYFGV
jgi:branched-chain amino acid transport system ATP-binding protein